MKVTYYPNGVVHAEFPTRKELTLTMCRIEEFFESPHEHIRGKAFDMAEFINTYADDAGNIDFFSYWDGFNVPVGAIRRFESLNVLTRHENRVLGTLAKDSTYLIATEVASDPTTLAHELAHAHYATDTRYRADVDAILATISVSLRARMDAELLEGGYCVPVLDDEVHAYLKTSDNIELAQVFPGIPSNEYAEIRTALQEVTCVS